eukprot:sb/3471099/
MKQIEVSDSINIPAECKVTIDRRLVTVAGPRGVLKKNFKHLQCELIPNKTSITIRVWFANRKAIACVRTICSHIENMFTGVRQGYKYKMKSVYAHFPININIINDNTLVEVHNFLGEKFVRKVNLLPGVTCKPTGNKDEIMLEGNDIENVSRSAALIQQSTTVKNKDIRKFLDGVYVSEKTNIDELPEED